MINFLNFKPIKKLTLPLRHSDGRSSCGRITSYHRGGGAKRKYRLVSFKRLILDIPAFFRRLEYDPNRSSLIALVCYANGVISYVLASEGMFLGSSFFSTLGYYGDYTSGSSLLLKNFPIGSFVHNVELMLGKGGKLVRSAGSYAQILKRVALNHVILKLKSGEHRIINAKVFASAGVVSNSNYKNVGLVRAGQARLLGRRPIVRGVAMNPIDHPHGGNTSGGRPSVSPWGKLAKGGKTRNRRKSSSKFILKGRLKRIMQ
jgi:large subunit ribosomal protein L2